MMRRLLGTVALCAITIGCNALESCGCGGEAPGPMAELAESSGKVELAGGAAPVDGGQWKPAGQGAAVGQGDTIRTGKGASAVVKVRGNGLLRVGPDAVVRFADADGLDENAAPGIEVERGVAILEATDEKLPLRTRFGTAVLEPGSKVKLTPGKKGVRFEIVVGGATFQHADGQVSELGPGQAIEVGIGMAILEDEGGSPVAEGEPAEPGGEPGAEPGAEPQAALAAVVKGQVRRRSPDGDDWADLSEGVLQVSSEIELDVEQGSSVEITRGNQRATLYGKGTFRVGGEGAQLVDAMDGRLSVESDDQDVHVSVPGGTIVARAVDGGSSADVNVRGEMATTTVRATRGQVDTEGSVGEQTIEGGEEATLTVSEEDVGEPEDDDGPPLAVPKPGGKPPPGFRRTLKHAEVVVPAGETFRVYDPTPPVAIGFAFEKCKEGGELRLRDGRRARGKEVIALPFRRGVNYYALHCIRNGEARPKAIATGKLRVVRNTGTARLPSSPPDNYVDTDGRNYTVMYQNIKPVVHISWPKAPKAGSYQLHLKTARGADRTLSSKKPTHKVSGKLLGDGKNVVHFTAGGKSSPKTTIELVFDNAAPAASIKKPPAEGFWGRAATTVSGVAVTGSKVSVGDTAVPLDANSRFDAEVPLTPGQRALAIRFQHRRHGVRYYVRRRGGAKR